MGRGDILRKAAVLCVPVIFAFLIFTGSFFARKAWEALNTALRGRGGEAVIASYVLVSAAVLLWIVFVRKERRFERYLSLFILAAAFTAMIMNMQYPDEKIHLGEFGLLAVITYFSFRAGTGLKGGALFTTVFIFCAIVGISDEIVQFFVPKRVCDWKDMLMNVMSGAIGLFAAKLCFHRDPE